MTNNTTYFYHDKPIFGLDIGHGTIKVMQIEPGKGKMQRVTGYGVSSFKPDAVQDGVIVDFEELAKAGHALFTNRLVGSISTRRVCMAAPASRTFSRIMSLPKLQPRDLEAAVRLEAEQYIPVPINDLYVDSSVIRETEKGMEVLAVATPKKVIDSYALFAKVLGLEVVSVETTTSATSRLFVQAEQSSEPTVLLDLGSLSADITIYDDGLVVTGTVPCGGDSFTNIIAESLKVSQQEAHIIKTKYGVGVSKKQDEIIKALKPLLEKMLREIRRMIRYYEERGRTKKKVTQVVTMGGGANMPGLSDYMTDSLRLAVRMCDPWQHLDFTGLQPPNRVEKSLYITVAGLSLTNPREIFHD